MNNPPITAFLVKGTQERFNLKRAWRGNAWRLTNEDGNDLVQPWFDTKTEAREFAKRRGWALDESRVS